METSRKCQRSDSLKKAERAKGLSLALQKKSNIGQTAQAKSKSLTGIQAAGSINDSSTQINRADRGFSNQLD